MKYWILICIILITLSVLFIFNSKMKDGLGPYNLRAIGITLVASLVAILSIAELEAAKLSAAFGILGAIAGYLFGLNNKIE
ncbi:hypothetical protein [Reichenbachiella sp.]|uniref:hypothetical protein n=1 Tax=Reichenbachiella sp. TaxID=2184521 RepID=UPI003B5969E0